MPGTSPQMEPARRGPREGAGKPSIEPPRAGSRDAGGAPAIGKVLVMLAADALLALVAFAVIEIVVVGALSWARFAGPYEMGRSMRRLLPLSAAAAVPSAIAGGALAALVMRGGERGARVALAGLAGAFAGAVAAGISTGRHFEAIAVRAPFVGAAVLIGAAVAFMAAPALARLLARLSRGQLAGGILAAVVALEAVNALVLPRLYPAFHTALAAMAILVVSFVPIALRAPRRAAEAHAGAEKNHADAEKNHAGAGTDSGGASPRVTPDFRGLRALLVGLGALSALALVQPSAKSLALADNLRLIYLERAPVIGLVVRAAAIVAPPKPVGDVELAQAHSGHAVDMTGRDILLISIDALGGDHVGAYG